MITLCCLPNLLCALSNEATFYFPYLEKKLRNNYMLDVDICVLIFYRNLERGVSKYVKNALDS